MSIERHYRAAAWDRYLRTNIDPELQDDTRSVRPVRFVSLILVLTISIVFVAKSLPRQVSVQIDCSGGAGATTNLTNDDATALELFVDGSVRHVQLEKVDGTAPRKEMTRYRLKKSEFECTRSGDFTVIVTGRS